MTWTWLRRNDIETATGKKGKKGKGEKRKKEELRQLTGNHIPAM